IFSLIASGAALIRWGAILGKTLGQIPSVAVQIEFRYPILGYSLDIVAGRLLAMVKIIENTVGVGCFSVEKRVIATGHAPISAIICVPKAIVRVLRSEEHTSELQSRENLVCR